MKSLEKFNNSNKNSILSERMEKNPINLEDSKNLSIFNEAKLKNLKFQIPMSENFRYKSRDDLSEYLNQRFPEKKQNYMTNQESLENEKNDEKIENFEKISNFGASAKNPANHQISESSNEQNFNKNENLFENNIKIENCEQLEKNQNIDKKPELNLDNLRESKESSIKQIEIEPPIEEGNNSPRVNHHNEPRLTEEEIKKYIKRLYLNMNLKAAKLYIMLIFVSVVFLYDLKIIIVIYVNVMLELYNIVTEVVKWKKDHSM